MQISATRHSSLISMVLTAGTAASGAAATSSGENTCDESVSEATAKDFGSSRLAVVSAAAFTGAESGALACAPSADGASGGATCDESGSAATTKGFGSSRPAV